MPGAGSTSPSHGIHLHASFAPAALRRHGSRIPSVGTPGTPIRRLMVEACRSDSRTQFHTSLHNRNLLLLWNTSPGTAKQRFSKRLLLSPCSSSNMAMPLHGGAAAPNRVKHARRGHGASDTSTPRAHQKHTPLLHVDLAALVVSYLTLCGSSCRFCSHGTHTTCSYPSVLCAHGNHDLVPAVRQTSLDAHLHIARPSFLPFHPIPRQIDGSRSLDC